MRNRTHSAAPPLLLALALLAAAAMLRTAVLAAAPPPVPRAVPALTVVSPAGKSAPLAAARKGDVVIVEFLLTNCPHCWRVAQTIGKVQAALGPQGLEAMAVAFDKDLSGPLVSGFATRSGITFPVAYATADKVDGFLGRQPGDRFQVPQVVVIDRAGMIRAQSLPVKEANLENETYLRGLLEGLLKEAPPSATAK
jgi:hypothetical protein